VRTRPLQVTALRITPPAPGDKDRGLVAYLRFCIGGIEVDGVTLRRTRHGDLELAFPARRDSQGRLHAYLRLDDAALRSVEEQIFKVLGAEVAP